MGLAIIVINDILTANMVASSLHSAAGALTGFCIEYVLSLFSNDSVALGADHLMGLAIIVINDILTALVLALSGLLVSAGALTGLRIEYAIAYIILLFACTTIIDMRRCGLRFLFIAPAFMVCSNSKRHGAQAHSHDQAQQHAYNFLHLLVLLSHLFCVCVYFAGYSRG